MDGFFQSNRTGPAGVSVDDLDLKTQERGNWPCSLLQATSDESAEAMLESSPELWWGEKAHRLTNPANTKAQNQGNEMAHPNINLIYELLEYVKGTNLQI